MTELFRCIYLYIMYARVDRTPFIYANRGYVCTVRATIDFLIDKSPIQARYKTSGEQK